MSKKQAYEEKLKAQLDGWNAKIDELKAKAKGAEADARIEYHETIEDLQEKRSDAKDKLQQLRQASDDAWEELKEGIEQAWSAMGAAINEAISRFK